MRDGCDTSDAGGPGLLAAPVGPMLGLPYDTMQPFWTALEWFVGPRRAHGR